MSIEALFDHAVTIKRPATVSGSYGVTQAYSSTATGVPAAVQRADVQTKSEGAGEVTTGSHRVFLAANATASVRDALVVTSGPEAPVTLRVVSATKPRGHHLELVCEVWEGALP